VNDSTVDVFALAARLEAANERIAALLAENERLRSLLADADYERNQAETALAGVQLAANERGEL
jgi:hypothetical protein